MAPTPALLGGAAVYVVVAVLGVLAVVGWRSVVRPPGDASVALLRDGEVVGIVEEPTLTVPFLTERRTVPETTQQCSLDSLSVETADGAPFDLDPVIHYEIANPKRFARETDSLEEPLETVRTDARTVIRRHAGEYTFSERFGDLEDRIERTLERAANRAGIEILDVTIDERPDRGSFPDFFPYHERFDRDEDGQLYATVEGNRVPIEDVFYDGSTDIADLKLLDVELEVEHEPVTTGDGSRIRLSVPDRPSADWEGAPLFAHDGEPFTKTPDGQHLSLYDLLDDDAVEAVTNETIAEALRDTNVDPEHLLVWARDGWITYTEFAEDRTLEAN